MAKSCPKCKKENLDSAMFCQHCGNEFKTSDNSKLKKNWYNQSSRSKFFIVLGIIGILLVTIFISAYLLGGIFPTKISNYENDIVSFNYISGWQFENGDINNGMIVNGSYNFTGPILLNITENKSSNLTLEEYNQVWNNIATNSGGKIISNTKLTVDGSPAYELTYQLGSKNIQQKIVYFIHNGTYYEMIFTTEDVFPYRRSIDTIIGSFHVK